MAGEPLSLYDLKQRITINLNADMVDGKHADGTANNIIVADVNGEVPATNPATAKYIPTSNIGGNIWIDSDSSNETYLYNTWKANTSYAIGSYVFAVNTDGNYRYQCTTAGISGAVEPSWVNSDEQTNTDNTIIWTCKKIVRIPTSFPWNTWKPSTSYVVGYVCLPMYPNGIHQYECITAGISGTAEPIWTTVEDVSITDNTAQWKVAKIINESKNVVKDFTKTHSDTWDDMIASGYYVINKGKTNAPEATCVYYLEVIADNSNNTYILQRATQLDNVALKMFVRAKISGTWGGWKQIYPLTYQ